MPGSWRVAPEAYPIAEALHSRGIGCGLASNFDQRLFRICTHDVSISGFMARIMVSSVVGWKKPAQGFFDAILDGYAPHEVLMVGDDLENDYHGARAAGLHAILLDDKTTLADFID